VSSSEFSTDVDFFLGVDRLLAFVLLVPTIPSSESSESMATVFVFFRFDGEVRVLLVLLPFLEGFFFLVLTSKSLSASSL
jgi:hypothetical protein